MALRVLHIGDVHLGVELYGRPVPGQGYGTRVADYLRCLDVALERAPEVDLILFAGDVYKSCQPTPTIQREFASRVHAASQHAPVVIIPGNHDVPAGSGRANSVDIFAALEFERIRVLRQPEVATVGTARGPVLVAAMPFVPRSLLLTRDEAAGKTLQEANAWIRERLTGWVDELLLPAIAERRAELGEATPCVALAHYTLGGAQFGGYDRGRLHTNEIELPPAALRAPAFDYVALGHIHRQQRIGLAGDQPPLIYAGSIERVDFSEEGEEKAVVLAEVARHSATWEPLPLPARRFLTLRVEAGSDDPTAEVLAAIEARAQSIAGAVVRVIYTLAPGLPNIPDAELRHALREAYYVAEVRRQLPERATRQRHEGLTTELTPLEAIREYLRTQPDLLDREEDLLRYAAPLIDEVLNEGEGG